MENCVVCAIKLRLTGTKCGETVYMCRYVYHQCMTCSCRHDVMPCGGFTLAGTTGFNACGIYIGMVFLEGQKGRKPFTSVIADQGSL